MIRPWHRDVIAGLGVLCLSVAAYEVTPFLALALLGVLLVLLAWSLTPGTGGNDDGS